MVRGMTIIEMSYYVTRDEEDRLRPPSIRLQSPFHSSRYGTSEKWAKLASQPAPKKPNSIPGVVATICA